MPTQKKNYPSSARWKAQHKRHFSLDLYENNQDMIDWLESQPSVSGYIKDLIRADMQRSQAPVTNTTDEDHFEE